MRDSQAIQLAGVASRAAFAVLSASRTQFFSRSNKATNFTFLITFICKYIVNYNRFTFAPYLQGRNSPFPLRVWNDFLRALWFVHSGLGRHQDRTIIYRLLLAHWLSNSFWYNTKIVYIYNYNNTIILSIIIVCIVSLDSFFGIDLAWQFNIILSYHIMFNRLHFIHTDFCFASEFESIKE